MAAKKKRVDPVKQREKRVKIAAIVGTVLMVLVGAYEIPSMLAVMNKKPPGNTRYDPGPSITPGGLPNVAAGAPGATAAATSSGQFVDTDVPPASGAGQLVSFSVFETKNPFTPQVSTAQAPSGTGAATTTTPTSANKAGADVPPTTTPTTTPATPPGASAVPSTQPAGGTTTTTAAPPAPTVSLSVNGVVSHVASGGTFPSGAPVFRLSSWTKDSAQIAIVGGSYASGTGTLTLHVGEKVTLENQTDGKRYTVELLST
jgi:hypothetical protein